MYYNCIELEIIYERYILFCDLSSSYGELKESVHVLAGIDTLYYQLVVSKSSYSDFYERIILKNKLDSKECEWLGETKQYKIYRFNDTKSIYWAGNRDYLTPLARLKFKNLNDRDGLEYIYVQLEAIAIYKFGVIKLTEMIKDKLELMGLEITGSKASRCDYNTFVCGIDMYKPYIIDVPNFQTKYRKGEHYKDGMNLETYYLGPMKIYNKILEESVKMDPIIVYKNMYIHERFDQKYNKPVNTSPYWNIEFSLDREHLKTYNIESIEDCFRYQQAIHRDMLRRVRLLSEPSKDQKNKDRIDTHPLWNILYENIDPIQDHQIDTERAKISRHYERNEQWLINRIDDFIRAGRGLVYDEQQIWQLMQLQKQLEQNVDK